MAGYLDNSGLAYLWGKIKALLSGKVSMDDDMNAVVKSSNSVNGVIYLAATCFNADNASANNHRFSLIVRNNDITLYDNTTSTYVWTAFTDESGALDVSNGGTGQTSLVTDTTIANIITAGTDVEITTATYSVWGKVAQLNVTAKPTTAKSGTWTVGTIVSGKAPKTQIYGSSSLAAIEAVRLTAGREISVNGSLNANSSVTLTFVYLLP